MLASLDLLRRLIGLHIRAQMQYRLPFILETLAVALSSLIGFLTLALVLQRFQNVGGWNLGEVALLYGLVETAFGLMDMIFSGFDPQFFGTQVRLGAFDQMLLRPVNITLQVFGSEFLVRRLGRITQGALVLGYALATVPVHWTAVKILFIPVILASLVCFFGGLFMIGAGITFWTIDSIEAMNVFTYGGAEMMSYPMHIYPLWLRRFFTFILPAIFLNYYPALYLLDKPDPFGLPRFAPFLAPAAGLAVLGAGLSLWQFGVRHYQSTGT